MDFRLLPLVMIGIAAALVIAACTPEEPTPQVDMAGTIAVQLASFMLTETASAHSPTPPPTPTPLPMTDTPIPEPTKDQSIRTVTVRDLPNPQPACRVGPDESYERISFINTPKEVELLGVGSVSGWYVIKNPYFGSPCWLPADILIIDPAMDLSIFPVMTPGH